MRIEAEHPKCHWTLVYVNPDNAQNVMVATKRVLRCYNCAKDLVRVATEDWKKRHAESQPVAFWDMAFRYLMADKPDKAMDWVEKGFEMHDPLMTYNTTPARYFDRLFGNPRFIAICERMKLPLPE